VELLRIATVLTFLILAEQCLACSFVRPKLKDGPYGLEPEQQNGYVFVGEVVGEELITAKSSKGDVHVVTLRVRVIDSSNQNTSPGTVHDVYQWTTDESCGYSPHPLTTSDFPVGTKIRVIADDFAIAAWELRYRVFRIR
jgi:hypothetical protein